MVPMVFGTAVCVDELNELLHNIASMPAQSVQTYLPKCIERVLASKACRSAIKFGDLLQFVQLSEQLADLSVLHPNDLTSMEDFDR